VLSNTTERLGTQPLGRLLINLSIPRMVGGLTLALYSVIDTFWVSRLGHEEVAVLMVVIPYQILVNAMASASGDGINALVSRRFGERNISVINRIAGQIFPITFIFGLFFIIAVVFFEHQILTLLGATTDIMEFAGKYLVVISFGAPFIFFSRSTNDLLRGSGEAIIPTLFGILATVLNAVLDPLLIFGIGPFPEMGIRGAALSTVISLGFGAVIGFTYIILARRSTYRIKSSDLKPEWSIIKDVYRIGFPGMVLDLSESIVFVLFNKALSEYGSLALAAGGIAMRVIDLIVTPSFAAAAAILPIIGYCLGARLWKRLWRAVKINLVSMVIVMFVVTIVLEIIAPHIIGLFTDDQQLFQVAIPALRILVSSIAVLGPVVLFVVTFQGLSKGKEALILSLIRQLPFFIPVLLLLNHLAGLIGVWWTYPVTDFIGFFVTGAFLLREYRKQQKSGLWLKAPN
jgi:putative MATE family efflux protein